MTGVVFPDQGAALQKSLNPGQRLVSPRGDLWRWDGYAASADAPSPAAVRLSQRNHLVVLETQIAESRERRGAAFALFSAAKAEAEAARAAERAAENEEQQSEEILIAAQDDAAKAARAAAERATQLASLESEIRRLTQSHDAARDAEWQATSALSDLTDSSALVESVADARSKTSEARAADSEGRAALDSLRRQAQSRAQRIAAIAEDNSRWTTRRDAAAAQIVELGRRIEEMRAELTTLEADAGSFIAAKRGALLDAIGAAEAAQSAASDLRAEAEQALRRGGPRREGRPTLRCPRCARRTRPLAGAVGIRAGTHRRIAQPHPRRT